MDSMMNGYTVLLEASRISFPHLLQLYAYIILGGAVHSGQAKCPGTRFG